jgi:hypothetical protein
MTKDGRTRNTRTDELHTHTHAHVHTHADKHSRTRHAYKQTLYATHLASCQTNVDLAHLHADDEGGGAGLMRRADKVGREGGAVRGSSDVTSVGSPGGSGVGAGHLARAGVAKGGEPFAPSKKQMAHEPDAETMLNVAAEKWGEVEAAARRRLEVEVETLRHEIACLHAERMSWEPGIGTHLLLMCC